MERFRGVGSGSKVSMVARCFGGKLIGRVVSGNGSVVLLLIAEDADAGRDSIAVSSGIGGCVLQEDDSADARRYRRFP